MEVGKTSGPCGIEARRAEYAGDPGARPRPLEGGSDIEPAHAEHAGRLGPARYRQFLPSIFSIWVAADPASLRVLDQAREAATRPAPLLIQGERGTGKTLLAEFIHYLTPGFDQPCLRLDCANLPSDLIEAHLFGSEPAIFDGSHPLRRGCLEMAGAGTLVLDEVAALPMRAQYKLLRALEQRQFELSGSVRWLPLKARVIALSSVDLTRAVARHSFREDLHDRLNLAAHLALLPLRDRPRDIRPLAEHFLAQCNTLYGRPHLTFSEAALRALEAYSFPGNVRELREIVEQAVLRSAPPEILSCHLPPRVIEPAAPVGAKISLEELERKHIAVVLASTRGRKTEAANILGISRKTLLEKRKRYGLG